MKTIDDIRRENIALLVAESGSLTALSEKTGKSQPQLSQWLNGSANSGTGKPRGMRSSSCRELEKLCNKPFGWMEVDHSEQFVREFANVSHARLGGRAIPVISAIQAGAMKEISDPYGPGAGIATLYTDDEYSRWAFALEIEGDSMEPVFHAGDLVIIEPDWTPRPGEYVAAKNGQQEATFKRYRQRGTDTFGNEVFELVPLNENYPTVRSNETPLCIIGVMAEHRIKARRR